MSQLPSRLPPDQPPPDQWPPSTPPLLLNWFCKVHLWVHTILASKCIFQFARSRPASVHDNGVQGYLQRCSITASKFAQSWHQSESPNLFDNGIHNWMIISSMCISHIGLIIASKCISNIPRSRAQCLVLSSHENALQVYVRVQLISGSKCISNLTPFWPSCGSLSSDKYCLQVHHCVLRMDVFTCSAHCGRVLCAVRFTVRNYIERLRKTIHAILWCSKSCDSNKDEYDRQNGLWLWNPNIHCCDNMAPSLKSPAEVPAALKVSPSSAQWSKLRQIWLFYKSNIIGFWINLYNCRCF